MADFEQLKISDDQEFHKNKWNGLVDKVSYAHRIHLTTDGKAGIGTTDPKESLQIGDRWTFHSGGAKFIGYNNYWDGNAQRRIVEGFASELRFERNGDLVIRMGDGSGSAEQQISFRAASGTIFKNDGKVGIGTWSPGNKLTVHYEGDMSQGGLNPSRWQAEFGTPTRGKLLLGSFDNQPAIQGHGTGTSFRLLLNPVGGNVGIGTRNPTEKLHVIGEVFAVNLRSSGSTNVGKALAVNGQATVGKNLAVNGQVTFGKNLTVKGQATINNINLRGRTKKTEPIQPLSGQDFRRLEVPGGKVVVGIEVKRNYVDDGDKDFYTFKLLYR